MSGLRYPGGKTRAVKILAKYIPSSCNHLVSIFLGGGSLEIHTAAKGVQVSGYDILDPLIAYWNCLLLNPDELRSEVQKKHPISKNQFTEYQDKLKHNQCSELEKAVLFFVLNRSSFSGTTMSGGFSKQAGENRFNQLCINKICKKPWAENIKVQLMDFALALETITDSDNTVVFADPPYVLAKKLYGVNGEGQNIDHELLMKKITKFKKWIITYDDCAVVRKLYKNNVIIPVSWAYGMNTTKKSNEIIIISDDLLAELWIDEFCSIELGECY